MMTNQIQHCSGSRETLRIFGDERYLKLRQNDFNPHIVILPFLDNSITRGDNTLKQTVEQSQE